MLKLELPNNIKDSGLSLPESTPKTLIQIEGENLPYACQCPCCGSIFNIPEGLLYKIEEDTLVDGDLGAEASEGKSRTDIDIDMGDAGDNDMFGTAPIGGAGATVSTPEAGESSGSII